MDSHFKNNSFIFWQRWLFYSSILFALAGVIFSISGNTFLFIPYDRMLAQVFWSTDQFPQQVDKFRSFIYAPFGGTIACAYILLAYIAYYPFRQKQPWARNAIVAAFTVWVIIDSSACIYFKVYPQVYIINLFSITVKALPLAFTWKDFGAR